MRRVPKLPALTSKHCQPVGAFLPSPDVNRLLSGIAALLCGFLAFWALHRPPAWQEGLPFARFPAAVVQPVESLEELREAVATHATRAGEKLRAQGLAASALWRVPGDRPPPA